MSLGRSSPYRALRSRWAGIASACGLIASLVFSPSAPARPAATSGEAFRIVAFDRQIVPEDRRALIRAGMQVIGYEPAHSYVVWGDARDARSVERRPGVGAVLPLPTDRKLADSLQWAPTGRLSVETIAHPSAVPSVVEMLGGAASLHETYEGLASVSADLSKLQAMRLAAHPGVLHVGPAKAAVSLDDELGALTVANSIQDGRPTGDYTDWLAQHQLDGKGSTVAVVDTGIWTNHPDLAGRVVKTISYGSPDGAEDHAGHGTHVAGIVAGDPANAGPGFEDQDGFAFGQGVAPQATLVNQNLDSLLGGLPDYTIMTTDAWKAGARILNASWSTTEGLRLGYVEDARQLDQLARDAIPGDRPEEILLVFAAGNDGEAGPATPHEAKNIIAVGATHSGRGVHYPQTSDIDEPAPFSARGPALDGRVFPTVVAPGAWLVSTRSVLGARSPSCMGPADGLVLYCSKSGTSMAAPHVSGTAALIHQWWKRTRAALPSPTLTKAMLVNTATDLGDPDIPNPIEGWGRINLGALLQAKIARVVDQDKIFRRVRDSAEYHVTVGSERQLRVTLSWADAAGLAGADPALVNDLDLRVDRIVGSRVVDSWWGNHFTEGWSTPGGSADRLNNIENVFLRGLGPGRYRISVIAANLPGDGIPNNDLPIDQDFALFATLGS